MAGVVTVRIYIYQRGNISVLSTKYNKVEFYLQDRNLYNNLIKSDAIVELWIVVDFC